MRVLITGGAGYIGSVLTPRLLRAGHTVTLVDRFTWGIGPILHFASAPNLNIVPLDIRHGEALRSVARSHDAVIHLAALVGYPACDADPAAAISTNVDGTRHLIAALDRRPLVFASTVSVNGRVEGLCDEDTPARPLTLYGQTKLEAEVMVREAGGVVLRFATLFGISPRLRLDSLVNDFVQQAVRHRRLDVYQSHFRRTFLHVRDGASSLEMALDRHATMSGRTYVVADEGTTMTKLELAQQIREQVDFELRVTNAGFDHEDRDYEVSCARIRSLGFSPSVSLTDGIRELVTVVRALRPLDTVLDADLFPAVA
jgi:nucleoside-diphosphate-sugar epimerase